jgi:hypothetical protein
MEEQSSEGPWETLWTGKELSGAISEIGWNEGGHPIDYDLGFLADTINAGGKSGIPTHHGGARRKRSNPKQKPTKRS